MKPPSRSALAALGDALMPGSRVERVRPLRGGISCGVHAVRLVGLAGARLDVVVRTYAANWHTEAPAVCAREFQLLEVLIRHGFPAPRPLLIDQDGAMFGAPTIVISLMPGRGMLLPRKLEPYLRQLALALAEIHRQPVEEFPFLSEQLPHMDAAIQRGAARDDPFDEQVWDAVRALWPAVRAAGAVALVHGDFWPGNTLWYRARLSGVVDWEMTRLGNPMKDVATCRCDLTNLFDVGAADTFTRMYEQASGVPVADLDFWDLYVATGALRYIKEWVVGYQALGRLDLSGAEAGTRVVGFARAALARAQRALDGERQ